MTQRVLGALGGNDVDHVSFRAWCETADVIYAADSGADRVLSFGFAPIVVGDFDSFVPPLGDHGLRLVRSEDQDTTDCDKLLSLAKEDGHSAITLIAIEGDLPDHMIATYGSAVASGLDVRFAFRRGIGQIVRSESHVRTQVGQRVSFMPMSRCTGVTYSGLRWNLDEADLESHSSLSVSNEATGSEVSVRLASGVGMLFVETREVRW